MYQRVKVCVNTLAKGLKRNVFPLSAGLTIKILMCLLRPVCKRSLMAAENTHGFTLF